MSFRNIERKIHIAIIKKNPGRLFFSDGIPYSEILFMLKYFPIQLFQYINCNIIYQDV